MTKLRRNVRRDVRPVLREREADGHPMVPASRGTRRHP